MPRSDTLSNPGTSKVFLCLVRRITYPKAIADFLKIKPPPVIQQLRRLQRIGIVNLGEKVGKEQNYEINWSAFTDLFLKNAVRERKKSSDVLIKPKEYAETTKQIKSLSQNRYFAQFVQHYLSNVAKNNISMWKTLFEIMKDVERVLPHFDNLGKKKHFDDPERQEFFDKMRLWYERVTEVQTWTELNLHDALQKILSPDKPKMF